MATHPRMLKPFTLAELARIDEDGQQGVDENPLNTSIDLQVLPYRGPPSTNPIGQRNNRNWEQQTSEERPQAMSLPLGFKLASPSRPFSAEDRTHPKHTSAEAVHSYSRQDHFGTGEKHSNGHPRNATTQGVFGEHVVPTARRFDRSLYWLAFVQRSMCLRQLIFLILLFLYSMLGAYVFHKIESRNERMTVQERAVNLEILLMGVATKVKAEIENPNSSTTVNSLQTYFRNSYVDMLKIESQYKYSTYYKLENDNNYKWSLSSSFFFCMNVYTTTGYGAITTDTMLGQSLTIIYACIFVPITLVIIRGMGQFMLLNFTKLYAHALILFRKAQGKGEGDNDEFMRLPIVYCILLLLVYLLGCTIFVYVYDEYSGSDGLSLFLSFYFAFVSLTTIGLGDVMPNNVTYAPLVSIVFFFGMCITKVVNRATYIAFENGAFGAMTIFENKVDQLLSREPEPKESKESQRPSEYETPLSIQGDAEKNEMLNNSTIKSIAVFMKSNDDVYGGGFGVVQIRRGDLLQSQSSLASHQGRV